MRSDYSLPVTKCVQLDMNFGSSLTHLEPELELFEVDDIGDDGDDDLSDHYLPKSFLNHANYDGFSNVLNFLRMLSGDHRCSIMFSIVFKMCSDVRSQMTAFDNVSFLFLGKLLLNLPSLSTRQMTIELF